MMARPRDSRTLKHRVSLSGFPFPAGCFASIVRSKAPGNRTNYFVPSDDAVGRKGSSLIKIQHLGELSSDIRFDLTNFRDVETTFPPQHRPPGQACKLSKDEIERSRRTSMVPRSPRLLDWSFRHSGHAFMQIKRIKRLPWTFRLGFGKRT